MTVRLPIVGGDTNSWGTVLNEFLGGLLPSTTTLYPTGDTSGADDQSAFAAALTTGGLIAFKPGDFYFTNIAKVLTTPVVIWGYGATLWSTLNKTDNTVALDLTAAPVSILGLTFDYVTSLTVDADAVNRAAAAHTIRVGVAHPAGADFQTGCLIRDVTVNNSRNTPITVYGYSKVRILDNTVTTALGNGIFVADCPDDTIIRGNYVEDTGDDSIAVVSDSYLAALCQRVIATGNTCYKSYGHGIDFTGVDGGLIDDNHVEKTWGNGIIVWEDSGDSLGTCNNVQVGDRNVIRDAGQYFGVGQYKTVAAASSYGVKVANGVSRIVVGYPTIINPNKGPVSFGVTGTGAIRRGQPTPQRVAASNYVRTAGVTVSTGVIVADRNYAVPVYITNGATATSLNVKVTSAGAAGSACRLGIYNDSGDFTPGNRLLDAGTVDTTGTGVKTAAISQALTPGLYWLTCSGQGSPATQPTMNILSGQASPLPGASDPSTSVNAYTQAGVSGALPASFTVGGIIGGGVAISIGF